MHQLLRAIAIFLEWIDCLQNPEPASTVKEKRLAKKNFDDGIARVVAEEQTKPAGNKGANCSREAEAQLLALLEKKNPRHFEKTRRIHLVRPGELKPLMLLWQKADNAKSEATTMAKIVADPDGEYATQVYVLVYSIDKKSHTICSCLPCTIHLCSRDKQKQAYHEDPNKKAK